MTRIPTTIRLSSEEAERFDEAAGVLGMSRSAWLRKVAERDAERVFREHRLDNLAAAELTNLRERIGGSDA